MNNISLNDIQNSVIPLRPLAEQHRVVTKVDELMALCYRLQARLADGDNSRRLLDSLMHEALAPSEEVSGSMISMIAQEVPDKAPGPPKVLTEPTTTGISPE